jgi:beta-glucosidase
MSYVFPKNFYWGAAVAAHQVEGNNHNDFSEFEKKVAQKRADHAENKFKFFNTFGFKVDFQRFKSEATDPNNYISGEACNFWNKWQEDFKILKELNLNSFRFSIEWSRIEPEENKFNEKALAHYQEMIDWLNKNNIEPFVTLWHFTNPIWFAEKGGWAKKENIKYFEKYVEYIIKNLKGVKFFITINEPVIYSSAVYIQKEFPPAKFSFFKFIQTNRNLLEAHNRVYKIIKNIDSNLHVGLAQHVVSFRPYKNWLPNKLITNFLEWFNNRRVFNKVINHLDFIGINHYQRFASNFGKKINLTTKFNDLGWEISPKEIYRVLMKLKKYNKPIIITENGTADKDDKFRAEFIQKYLKYIHKAISKHVDVRGYMHWSLLDNFEWDNGFWPRFGLVEVDYKTQERKIRDSARVYGEISERGQLTVDDR